MDDLAFRRKVIEHLYSLTDEDLARLFYEAMSTRNEYRRHAEDDFWNHVYVLGIASHMSGGPAEIEILATALDQDERLDEVKQFGANQSGRCELCRTIVASTSKIAACPVCQTPVECT